MTGDPADMPTCPACGAACGSTLTIQMLRLDAPDVQCSACGHRWQSEADHARAKASDAAWMAREEEIARRPWR
jgi:transcription elongation factor Elf1